MAPLIDFSLMDDRTSGVDSPSLMVIILNHKFFASKPFCPLGSRMTETLFCRFGCAFTFTKLEMEKWVPS